MSLGSKPGQPRPATATSTSAPRRRFPLVLGGHSKRCLDVLTHLTRVPSLATPCHPLDLRLGQSQRLAELPDRAASPVGGKRSHQGGAIVPIALVDARD